ncbi:MAG: uracil-DNA glycosylase [Acidobacteria bacterium]|nr:uracil-DNA glycosylase [Acidobacteriota bacterium]MBV9476885.1 uracil-DNA glycosylase [Acidobacteriota bacterium]
MNRDFAAHLEALYACRACPNVFGEPVTGACGDARVMLVGQAPGPREADYKRPFAYTAGKRLFAWIAEHLGIEEADFRARVHIGSVIRCFPGRDLKNGGDRVPDATEIANCGAHLDRELRLLRPELVISVGTLSAKQLVGIAELKQSVGRMHRVTRAGHSFDVVVLPHPSGRSTWMNKPEHAALFAESMRLIREHPAFSAAPEKSSGYSAKSRARRR